MDVGKYKWNGLRVTEILRICVCFVLVFMAVSLNSCQGKLSRFVIFVMIAV